MGDIGHVAYQTAPEVLRRDIAMLMHDVWPDVSPLPTETMIPNPHDEGWQADAFYLYIDGHLASYAGIVQKAIMHQGHRFQIAGLSCVATAPACRGRRLGHQTVAAATQWLERQPHVDLGIFTCHPSLAGFYADAGGWQMVPDVRLIGSEEAGALSSDALPVVVMQRLLSEKARDFASALRHTPINLQVPAGQFI